MSQVFIVTGAASGVGRHITGAFANRGYRVLASDLSVEALDRAAREDGWPDDHVRRAAIDVRSDEAWRIGLATALDAFGRVDVLLNIAGFLRPSHIWDATDTDVDLHLDVNVKGVAHGMRVVGEHFVRQRHGHIVNFGSLASLAPVPGLTLYSAAKHAVRGLSLAAAQELSDHGVAVTVVMPDAIATPMLDLQIGDDAAALTFSGRTKPLSVTDIERLLVERVLPKRPLEVTLPWERGLLARVAGTVPAALGLLRPFLVEKGLRAQQKLRK